MKQNEPYLGEFERNLIPQEFNFDKMVVGSTLAALAFAYVNKLPIIIPDAVQPQDFQPLPHSLDLSPFHIQNEKHHQTRKKGKRRTVGVDSFKVWNKIYFLLAIDGLNPFHDRISSAFFRDEDLLISTKGNKRYSIQFNKAFIFDNRNILGINFEQSFERYHVRDWFNVVENTTNAWDLLENDEDFMQEILFFPRQRHLAHSTVAGVAKDILVRSTIGKHQIDDFNFSSTMVQLRLEQMFKKKVIEFAGRQANLLCYLDILSDDERLEMMNVSFEEVLDQVPQDFEHKTAEMLHD